VGGEGEEGDVAAVGGDPRQAGSALPGAGERRAGEMGDQPGGGGHAVVEVDTEVARPLPGDQVGGLGGEGDVAAVGAEAQAVKAGPLLPGGGDQGGGAGHPVVE